MKDAPGWIGRLAIMAAAALVFAGVGFALWTQAQRRHEASIQEKNILSNLRRIDAAIGGYRHETGRYPASLDEIVGKGKFLQSLDSVAGEDYRTVDLSGADLLRVTTSAGIEFVYSRRTATAAPGSGQKKPRNRKLRYPAMRTPSENGPAANAA